MSARHNLNRPLPTTAADRTATPDWQIRDFAEGDYDGLVGIYSEVYPDHPQTAGEIRKDDADLDPKCRRRRWVATEGEDIVGVGQYSQWPDKYDPRTFYLNVCVRENYRNKRIGTALSDTVVREVDRVRPRRLRSHAREDRPEGIRFLAQRGYCEYRRESDSRLDVDSFDPSPYNDLETGLRREGIVLKTLRELESDPDRDRKLYDLDWLVTRDEPGSEDDTRVSFDLFVSQGINAAHRLPDGYFIAVHDGEYIGLCLLNAVEADGSAHHGITGVTRAFRRRGLATALKTRAIRYAQEAGIPYILTSNEIGNRPMLAINRKLGYIPLPAWIFYEKRINTD